MGRPRAFDLINANTTDTKNADDRKFVGAIGRAFDVLRAFKPGQGPLGNTELSVATGLPKATVSRLTHTLTRLGYLNYLSDHGVYEPSPSILALGYCVLSNMRVRQLARDHMQQLADYGKTMCALASRDRLSMIYVSMCNGGGFRTLHMDVGSRADIATSAIGRAFLSGISERERDYFFGHFHRIYGLDWPALQKNIQRSIREVEERGFCMVDGEWQRDVRAVAAPLVSPDGQTVMSMNCAGPTFHLTTEILENDLGPRLAHLCRGLAPMLGG
jgi:DNA-binding IclR family transcriptional regulator